MLVKVLNKETGEAVSMGLQENMTLDKVRDKLFSTGIMLSLIHISEPTRRS